MATFLGLTEAEFIQRYCRLAANRYGLALAEAENGACVFLKGQDCLVHPVKPQQCRDFPNLWRFDGFELQCQARPHWMEWEEYVQAVSRATGRGTAQVRALLESRGVRPVSTG